MYSQQLSVLHWMNNFLISKIIYRVPEFLFLKKYWLVEVTYLLIRFNKTNFFPWNTNNTERYGINKQKNTPPFTQRNIEKSDWKGFVSTKKVIEYPLAFPLCKTIHLFSQPFSFYGKNMNSIFENILKTQFFKFLSCVRCICYSLPDKDLLLSVWKT